MWHRSAPEDSKLKVLFLHHQQRRHFREEPGYNELYLSLHTSPRITASYEFVYQTMMRQFFGYEILVNGARQIADVTEPDRIKAYIGASQSFFPCLQQVVETCQPDLIVNSISWPFESIGPHLFTALKQMFPRLLLFTQLWDYDEQSESMTWYEQEIIKVSDLVAICDNHARLEKIHRREGVYSTYENVDAVVWLPTRPDPAVFKPVSTAKSLDICLLGSTEGFRKTVIDDLDGRYGLSFLHAGGYMADNQYVPPTSYADLIRRARIVVNTQTQPERQQVKGRSREVLACGGFLLDQENSETARFFEGSGVVLWRDLDDLHSKIDHYLTHDSVRRQIAADTHAWYMRHYPAETYFDEILDLLRQRGRL
jgi:hypothetical protein